MNDVAILTPEQFARIRTLSKIQPKYILPEEPTIDHQEERKEKLSTKPKIQQKIGRYNENKNQKLTHIPSLQKKSKSALALKKNAKVTIPKASNLKKPMHTGNKTIMKKSRVLPPSLVNTRNKNNKLSKIPFRQSRMKDRIDNDKILDDNTDIENSFSSRDDQTCDEEHDFKHTLNQFKIKRIASPFDFEEENKSNDSFSKTRSNIMKLQSELDTLKTKRKKELNYYQTISSDRIQNSKYFKSNDLIKGDSESLLELRNDLRKLDLLDFSFSHQESD